MKRIHTLFAISLLLLVCPSCRRATAQPDDTTAVAVAPAKAYSLDENIGAMLLIGFRGTAVDSSHHVVRDLRDYHVGSVILFDYDVSTGKRGRNIVSADQLRSLCRQLRQYNPRLLIGVDQEGGYVSRLSPRYGFPRIPTARRLGQMGDDSVRHYAAATADMLTSVGFNLNFAPVADVDVNPACPVIGAIERSFSPDAHEVARLCRLWVDAQRGGGVVSCMKHFPGHGSAHGDTHRGLVDVTTTWQRTELVPYRDLPADGLMVMTAHVVNRQLDPSGLPASLSPRITALLRDTLGFDGVIVTDDLAMGAISSHYGFEQAVQMAVLAGADLLCLSNNGSHYDTEMVPRAVAAIRRLVDEGRVDADRLRRSADRVRALQQHE